MLPPIVDLHVHVMAGAPDPVRDGYEIWEYGVKEDVESCDLPGTIDDVAAAMAEAEATHFVTVNMFVPDIDAATLASAHPEIAIDDLRARLPQRLKDFNAWALDVAQQRSDMSVFVAMDPHVLGGSAGADHLRWAQEHGACGVKVHPVLQRFHPDDPRMQPIYQACQELDLVFLSHAGSSKNGRQFAEPSAFASVLEKYPRLPMVLAHLGGGHWRQALDLARAFPNVGFDLCEIIAWTGAPAAPSIDELGWLIAQIGSDRVYFGSDFPWYSIERTAQLVMDLPHLAQEQRLGILGRNAIENLGLPVAGI